MRFFAIITPFLFFVAQANADIGNTSLQCEVIIAASDLAVEEGVWKFSAKEIEGSHGGEAREFAVKDHRVTVIADGIWLGIGWWRGDRKVGESVTVLGQLDVAEVRVLLLYDPLSSDQASIGCNLVRQ